MNKISLKCSFLKLKNVDTMLAQDKRKYMTDPVKFKMNKNLQNYIFSLLILI